MRFVIFGYNAVLLTFSPFYDGFGHAFGIRKNVSCGFLNFFIFVAENSEFRSKIGQKWPLLAAKTVQIGR